MRCTHRRFKGDKYSPGLKKAYLSNSAPSTSVIFPPLVSFARLPWEISPLSGLLARLSSMCVCEENEVSISYVSDSKSGEGPGVEDEGMVV